MSGNHPHGSVLSETDLRVRALQTLLVDKGYVDPDALDALIETYEHRIGPHNGARVFAGAWSDPAYRERLLLELDIAAPLALAGLRAALRTAADATPHGQPVRLNATARRLRRAEDAGSAGCPTRSCA